MEHQKCAKQDLAQLNWIKELCLGQKCGVDYSFHCLSAFEDENVGDILLIGSKNAFSILNCQLALRDIQNLCTSFVHLPHDFIQKTIKTIH